MKLKTSKAALEFSFTTYVLSTQDKLARIQLLRKYGDLGSMLVMNDKSAFEMFVVVNFVIKMQI